MIILFNCVFKFFSVTQYYTSSLNVPLDKNSLVTIHQRNLRCLAIEMFKINNKLSTPFICDLIHESTSKYHTIAEEENVMSIPKAKKVKMGIESYRPYNMVHTIGRIGEYQVFRILQIEIENWKFTNCIDKYTESVARPERDQNLQIYNIGHF